jgi:hypothetical protein
VFNGSDKFAAKLKGYKGGSILSLLGTKGCIMVEKTFSQ